MNKNFEIQRKVEDAMSSLEDIQRQEPAPFFYTRVQARLSNEKKNAWELMARTIARPVFAFSSILLIVLINSFVVITISNAQQNPESAEVAIADEFRSTNSFYDLENVMP